MTKDKVECADGILAQIQNANNVIVFDSTLTKKKFLTFLYSISGGYQKPPYKYPKRNGRRWRDNGLKTYYDRYLFVDERTFKRKTK